MKLKIKDSAKSLLKRRAILGENSDFSGNSHDLPLH
jgi:hypothetical protein